MAETKRGATLAEVAAPLIDVLDKIARKRNVHLFLRVDVKPDGRPVSMTLEARDGSNRIVMGRYVIQKDEAGVWGVL